VIPDYTEELEVKVTKNTDKLVHLGFKNWSMGRSGKKSKKDLKDQLRDIED
jgi:hypothetical protein